MSSTNTSTIVDHLFHFVMEQQNKQSHEHELHTPPHPSTTTASNDSAHEHHHQTSRNVRTPTKDVDTDHHLESNETQDKPESPELSLRFPRPVGNTHLANWISTSDPDIMHMRITTESVNEGGLADSTYELLTHADDTASENGSQDNNDESFSESVSSLDHKRNDDNNSFVSEDDEEEMPMLIRAPSPATEKSRPLTPLSDVADDNESEDESDTNSRSSLEYIHEKLGTPSMSADETPKASAFIIQNKMTEAHGTHRIQDVGNAMARFWEIILDGLKEWSNAAKSDYETFKTAYQRQVPTAYGPYVGLMTILVPFLIALFSPVWIQYVPGLGRSAVSTVDTTDAPQILAPITTTSTSASWVAATGVRTDLNVREEPSTLDWFFARNPGLSYSTIDNTIVVDIPPHLKQEWVTKGCVAVTATRDGKTLDTPVQVEEVTKGLAASLPRRERYGDVDFFVKTTCGLHIKQHVTVNFGPYESELTALARQTKDLALWYAESKKQKWAKCLDFLVISPSRQLIPTCDKAVKHLGERWTLAKEVLAEAFEPSKVEKDLALFADNVRRDTELMVRDAQNGLQLGLLNSQINAKLWWLKVTRQNAAHEIYSKKAAKYMADKEARGKIQLRRLSRPRRSS